MLRCGAIFDMAMVLKRSHILLIYGMLARASCLAGPYGHGVRNSSLSPAHIYLYMASLLELTLLSFPHGEWYLVLLPLPAQIRLLYNAEEPPTQTFMKKWVN